MNYTINCLLVDDDADDREIFMLAIASIDRGIDCRTANSGREALALLDSPDAAQPDFIFLDVNMPKMNGLECLEKLREAGNTSKVYMYSTTAEPKVVERSKQFGADFIVKPTSHRVLQEILTDIFAHNDK